MSPIRLTLDVRPEGTAGQVPRVNAAGTALEYADAAPGGGGGTSLPADAAGWLHDDGSGALAWSTPTAADVGADAAGAAADAQAASAPAASAYSLPSAQEAATAYTLAVVDRGKVLEFTAATAVTVTVPPASTADLGADAVVNGYQAGAGQLTFVGGTGVTLRAPDGAKTAKQFGEVSLRRRGTTDEWVLSGNVTT